MPTNPYAPPQSASSEGNPQLLPALSSRNIVFGWEKLRLIFNGVLLLPGFGILYSFNAPPSAIIGISVTVGICANLCFFLGPIAELYICALTSQSDNPKLRTILFSLGLGGSLLLFLSIFIGLANN